MPKSKVTKEEDSDSDLSDAPSTLSEESPPKTTLKRKRNAEASTIIKPEEGTLPAEKPRRKPTKKVKLEDGPVLPPPDWERVYSLTQEMRANMQAPVDTMGCEQAANANASPKDQRLSTLIALMLSSQTKDPVTFAAIQTLESSLPGGLCLQALLDVEPGRLNQLIGKVGFHNNKTKYIKATALLLKDKFGGDIPETVEGLTSLPGVGPKMAYLTMSAAWGKDEGIGVDVHVHRITNLWGWHKTTNPEDTRKRLEAWLPKDKWHEINHLLVGFGQMLCLPVGRKCGDCKLAEERLCPGAVTQVKREVTIKRTREIKIEMDGEKEEVAATNKEVKVEEAPANADGGVKKEVIVEEMVKTEELGDSVDLVQKTIKVEAIADIEDMATIKLPLRKSRTKSRRVKVGET
ncbi:DNA glycosylase [Venturia nashicola]|nr:DNA glycosylase [Venturia nashicola]